MTFSAPTHSSRTAPETAAARPLPEGAERDPIRASQHIFRVCLDALANPGTVHRLVVHPSVAMDDAPGHAPLASILMTLLDHEVSFHITPSAWSNTLTSLVARRTKASVVPAEAADFVAADARTAEAALPESLRRGSLQFPDDSATLLLVVPSLDQALPDEPVLMLSGPGIDGERPLRISGLSGDLIDSRNRAVDQYPTGIDLFLIDGIGRVVGLPRTTTIATGR